MLATALLWIPLALWVSAYFWVNSTPGRAAVLERAFGATEAEAIQLADLRWGPAPDRLELIRFAVVGEDGAPILRADHVQANVDLRALLDGHLTLDDVTITGYGVRLAWDAEGRSNIERALRSDPSRDSGDAVARAPRPSAPPAGDLTLNDVNLRDGEVSLDWPTWGLDFQGVDTTGRITVGAGQGVAIDAELVADASSVAAEGREALRYERLVIEGFSLRDGALTVHRVRLDGADGQARVQLAGGAIFDGEVAVEARGDLALSAAQAQRLDLSQLPEGGQLTGLVVSVEGEALSGSVDLVRAPRLVVGPVTATDVSTRLASGRYVAGLLRPTGLVRLEDTRAARLAVADDVDARDVQLAHLTITSSARTSVDVGGATVAELTTPGGTIGPARADALVEMRLTSGTVDAFVDTGDGTLGAHGAIRFNPLRGSVRVTLDVGFSHATGALATYLAAALNPGDPRALALPLDGHAVIEGHVAERKAEGAERARWTLETELRSARLRGGGDWTFDGATWRLSRGDAPR